MFSTMNACVFILLLNMIWFTVLSRLLWSVGFFCGQPCDMELVIRQSERSGRQQRLFQAFTEDFFIYSLLVYIAHYSFLDDALYKFTNLLT